MRFLLIRLLFNASKSMEKTEITIFDVTKYLTKFKIPSL